ncbi:MAG: hypothetical protein NXI22_03055 [bacterium]|nr:hypothetical protein [bacterium]
MDKCSSPSKLNTFLQESLDQQESAEIAEHVERCERCQRELESVCVSNSHQAMARATNISHTDEWNDGIIDRAIGVLQADAKPTATAELPTNQRPAKRWMTIVWPLLASLAGLLVLSPFVGRFFTQPEPTGNIEVEINDAGTTLTVTGASSFSVTGIDYQKLAVTPGKHAFTVVRGDLNWKQPNIELHDGDIIRIHAERVANSLTISHNDKTLSTHRLRETLPTP